MPRPEVAAQLCLCSQARVARRSRGHRSGVTPSLLILLTDLLTTDNRPGQLRMRLDQAVVREPGSRPVRQLRTDLDGRNLATDQKVRAAMCQIEQLRSRGIYAG